MTLAKLLLVGSLSAIAIQASAADDATRDMLLAAKMEATRVVSPSLAKLGKAYPTGSESLSALQAKHGLSPAFPYQRRNGRVLIDAISTGDTQALMTELASLGMKNAVARGNLVSGELPISAISELHHCPSLKFASPVAATTRVGLTTSQGDAAMYTDKVRKDEDVNGSGIRVGVLSDSFDCNRLEGDPPPYAADDIASGDLPVDIIVLEDIDSGCIDEGRAMMQLIHDVAPGASQAFHTAFTGQAGFAQGIIDLATVAGSDIIVDDVIYFAEPMFQDGVIAQAADAVKAMGVPYFSSAGNNGRSAYEAPFRSSGVGGFFGGERHDFDPTDDGVDTLQSFIIDTGLTIFSFQWDQPFASVSGGPGSQSDVDVLFYLPGGIPLGFGGTSFNIGQDAVEVFAIFNDGPPAEIEIGIELFAGPPPGNMKYVHFGSDDRFGLGAFEFDTDSGTVYGHAGAEGAMAVGASAFFNTKRFNKNCKPACLNSFSSAGPVHILFDTAGNPISELRQKPEVVGPDGGNTTFFGGDLPDDLFPGDDDDGAGNFGNFFGTSASAPHIAALAALILQENPNLTPDQVYRAMEQGAKDMKGPLPKGVDDDSGFGFVDGRRAFEKADDFSDDDSSDDDSGSDD